MYNIFEKEISYIKDDKIKNSLITILEKLPDYFYEIPASSTGKYHPSFSLNKGGLVRHTKAAVRIAKELMDNSSITNFTDEEKDLIIFALCVHDGLKSGITKSQYTVFEHPLLISSFIKDNKSELELNNNQIELICSMVETHMGPFTKNYKGEEVLSPPNTKYQRFVHMCDYLSSKKFLDIKFDENDNIIE